jgi:hypothetical protein
MRNLIAALSAMETTPHGRDALAGAAYHATLSRTGSIATEANDEPQEYPGRESLSPPAT